MKRRDIAWAVAQPTEIDLGGIQERYRGDIARASGLWHSQPRSVAPGWGYGWGRAGAGGGVRVRVRVGGWRAAHR